jgi:hypothetical protein
VTQPDGATVERYARVVTHGRTKLARDHAVSCDADVLLAAAYATSGDERKLLALRLYRAQASGDYSGLHVVAKQADNWLNGRSKRKGQHIPRRQREQVVIECLRWWVHRRCDFCGGVAFEAFETTGRLSVAPCEGCGGTGETSLRVRIPWAYLEHAEWLVDELDRLVRIVFADMARLLRVELDALTVGPTVLELAFHEAPRVEA